MYIRIMWFIDLTCIYQTTSTTTTTGQQHHHHHYHHQCNVVPFLKLYIFNNMYNVQCNHLLTLLQLISVFLMPNLFDHHKSMINECLNWNLMKTICFWKSCIIFNRIAFDYYWHKRFDWIEFQKMNACTALEMFRFE